MEELRAAAAGPQETGVQNLGASGTRKGWLPGGGAVKKKNRPLGNSLTRIGQLSIRAEFRRKRQLGGERLGQRREVIEQPLRAGHNVELFENALLEFHVE